MQLGVSVATVLDQVKKRGPEEWVSVETQQHIDRIGMCFSDFFTSEMILETHLGKDPGNVDVSFRVLAEEAPAMIKGFWGQGFKPLAQDVYWHRIQSFCSGWPEGVEEIWIEMDQSAYEQETPQPCFFFDASAIGSTGRHSWLTLQRALSTLIPLPQVKLFANTYEQVIRHLPPESRWFQVGVMLARHEDRFRVFTGELTWEQSLEWMHQLPWIGETPPMAQWATILHRYSDGKYIWDIDIAEEGVPSKIGCNFGLKNMEDLSAFLDVLVEKELCKEAYHRIITGWLGRWGGFLGKGAGYSALLNQISHFKITWQENHLFSVKVYLKTNVVSFKQQLQKAKRKEVPEVQAVSDPYGREIQTWMRTLMRKASLDNTFRNMCLQDSRKALEDIAGRPLEGMVLPTFIEATEQEITTEDNPWIIQLPDYLEENWLTAGAGGNRQ